MADHSHTHTPSPRRLQEIFELVEWDAEGQALVFKVADVRENKKGAKKGQGLSKKQRERQERVAFGDVVAANLYLDI